MHLPGFHTEGGGGGGGGGALGFPPPRILRVSYYSTICKFKSEKRGVYNVINVRVLPSKPRTRQTHQRVEERE